MTTERKRLDNLDLMKAMGILMVLSLHVPLWNVEFFEVRSVSRIIQYALRLQSEGVPLFMFVNGYLLFRKSSFDLKKHVKKTARLIALFFVWALILSVSGQLMQPGHGPITVGGVLGYILDTQVGSYLTGVLWFLENMVAVYLVFPFLRRIYESGAKLYHALFGVVATFTLGIGALELASAYAGTYLDMTMLNKLIALVYRFNPIGNAWYLFYFLLGGFAQLHAGHFAKKRLLYGALGLVSWGCAFVYGFTLSNRIGSVYNPSFNYASVFMAVSLVGLYALALPYVNRGNLPQRFVASVGQNTLGIYFCHYLFIFTFFMIGFPATTTQRILWFVYVFAASYIFTVVIKRIPVLRELVIAG